MRLKSLFIGLISLFLFTTCSEDTESACASPDSFFPTRGTDNDELTIIGSNFGNSSRGVQVFFGEVEAQILDVTDSEITVSVPPAIDAAEVMITLVIDCAGSVVLPTSFVREAPTILSISPTSVESLDEITISGSNFGTVLGANEVLFDDDPVTITSFSANELRVIPPFLLEGTFEVSVRTAGQSSFGPSPVTVEPSVVSYYPLNGNVNDAGPGGNDGVNIGGEFVADRFGNANSAIRLDGVNDFIEIDAIVEDIQSSQVGSFSFWMNTEDSSPVESKFPISFGDININSWVAIFLRDFDGSGGGLYFSVRSFSTTDFRVFTTNNEIGNNEWVHVACVQDGVMPKIYIDGELVPQTNDAFGGITNWFDDVPGVDNARLGILNQNGRTQGYFAGILDDIMVFDRALSAEEVLYLYANDFD